MVQLETERLRLRPLTVEDKEGFVPLLNNWEVARWLARVPHPYTATHFDEFAVMTEDHLAQGHEPGFGIVIKDGPAHAVGSVGVHADRSRDEGVAGLGYWIGEPFWGQGYMSEAVAEAARDAFTRRGLNVLTAGFLDGNEGSGRVLEKLGFEVTGKGFDYSLANDAKLPATFVQLTSERWTAISGNP